MNRKSIQRLAIGACAVLLLCVAPALIAQGQDKAEAALKAAMDKETVDGNLKIAIEQYKKLAQNSNKSVAARALVRLGECYEKQGSADARKTYEQVLSKFGDQKDAVDQARARLASMGGGGAAQQTTRVVWTGDKVDLGGSVSPDGRYISFTDWDNGNLALHDLISGTDRLITNDAVLVSPQAASVRRETAEVFAEESAISRDGKQVAFNWYDSKKDSYELRLANLTGDPNPRRLFDGTNFKWIAPLDWSTDGKWIVMQLSYKDKGSTAGEVGLVAVQDGSMRVLNVAGIPRGIRFSRDGKYLAYDRVAGGTGSQRGIYVMAIDGGSETQVVSGTDEKNHMMGWSPDGKQLLFTSDGDLWAMPFSDAKPQSAAAQIKKGFSGDSLGVTGAGAIYIGSYNNRSEIRVSSVDLSNGKRLPTPVPPFSVFGGQNGQQAWSRDGKYLAYCSSRTGTVPVSLMEIRPAERGDVRDFRLPDSCGSVNWAPDGRSIAFTGKNGLSRIDLQTGEVTPLLSGVASGSSYGFAQFSPDGKKVYYLKTPAPQATGVAGVMEERDLATGRERELFHGTVPGFLSPDGQYFARNGGADPATGAVAIELIPASGGDPRVAFRAAGGTPGFGWTPDSQGMVLWKNSATAGKPPEAWVYPINGSAPHQLDIDTSGVPGGGPRPIRVSPDGRQIAFAVTTSKAEVQVLENFLPVAKASK